MAFKGSRVLQIQGFGVDVRGEGVSKYLHVHSENFGANCKLLG